VLTADKRFQNQRTASYPAVIHFNGGGKTHHLRMESQIWYKAPEYNTVDATLWFFHALHRYLNATGDFVTLEMLWPTMSDIIRHHFAGTDFNIHVDPDDGLLCQGKEGYQLTWMDAKMGDWVVTPRRGKAVEINALWYKPALMADWARSVTPSSIKVMRSAPGIV
jgi:predicted glycogen debranching enzyme